MQTGVPPQLSEAETVTVTGTILWFGGQRMFGLAVTAPIVGGWLSTTVTVAAHELEAPLSSVTVRVTLVVPKPYGPAGVCTKVIGSPSGSKEPLFTDADAVQTPGAVGIVTFWH